MKTGSCIYCIYVSQSIIAGEEVTVVQSCVDHHGGISREVCSVQDVCQVHQGNVLIVPGREVKCSHGTFHYLIRLILYSPVK